MPIMREMNYQWSMDYDFRHEASDRVLGPALTPHEAGVAETVRWFESTLRPA